MTSDQVFADSRSKEKGKFGKKKNNDEVFGNYYVGPEFNIDDIEQLVSTSVE